MRVAALVSAVALLCGCQKTSPIAEGQRTFRPPSATEVFNLRTKCAELGDRLLETVLKADVIGAALAHEATSRYDPKTDRCYVRLDVHTADFTKYAEMNASYLYDGQTREILAYASSEHGAKTGQSYIDNEHGYDAGLKTIEAFMADDRKQ